METSTKRKGRGWVFRLVGALLAASFLMGLLGGCSDSKSSSPPPLTGPSNVAATPESTGSADVSWDAISGITDYKIYYSNTTPVNRTTAANLTCNTNSCTVTGLDYLNNPYYIVVTAMYGTAESLPSQEERVDLPPVQPTSVTAMPGDTQITLIWGSVEEATGYNIYRGTAPGVTKTAPPYMVNVLSPHVDTNVINGTSYFYTVTSLGQGGESILSNEVGAVFQPQELLSVSIPAVTLLPEFARLHEGEQNLDGAGAVHFLPDDGFHLAKGPQPKGKIGIEAGGELPDHSSTEHQLATGNLRLRGDLFQRRKK